MRVVVQRRSRKPIAPRYTREDVITLSDANNEPQWLRDLRLESWQHYESLPMPQMEEEWRRTDYSQINWGEADSKVIAGEVSYASVPEKNLAPLVGEGQGGLIVIVDGKVVHAEIAEELSAQGIVFTDLRTAIHDYENIVRDHLMTQAVKPTDGKFAALHGALWEYGVFAYVPRGKVAELPLHAVVYNTQSGASFGHVLTVVEENAEATMQIDYASADMNKQASYIGATELIVKDEARLRYVALQDWNRNTYEFSHQRGIAGKNANLDWVIGTMGTRLTKSFIEVDLNDVGTNTRVSGFFFADKNQFFDLDTQQNHNGPLTTSDLLFKGAARDNARTLWQGMIKSLPQMQKIDGYQVCRNLVLGDDARMDGIPGLEIEADDVMCSHAATFGTLEEEPIHYLMSRGISRPQAELMVIDGFFDELLLRIPFERVRTRLMSEIEAKIIGQ